MDYQNLKFENENGICILTINRPQALNALNSVTIDELHQFFVTEALDDSIHLVILTGSGEKAFVAGADIAEMQSMSAEQARVFSQCGQSAFDMIENLQKPVIAAINGFALGGGCELAMACDIRIASDKARFGQPEVSLGIIPGYGGTQRLSRLVGKGRAKEMLFTGDIIDATEAYRIGLVNKVVPADELMSTAKAMAEKIMSRGPVAVKLTKAAVNKGLEGDLASGLALEAEMFGLCFSTADQNAGMAAFLAKSTAKFIGA
ncbi:MAG: enoyl-CoA hydratase-related protein [Betaproteobacteria bacterium]